SAAALGNAANALIFTPGIAGKLQAFGANPTAGGLSGDTTATIENGSATNSTFILGTTIANTFNGTFQNGSGGGTLAWRLQGGGTLSYGGTSTSSGTIVIRQGRMILTGALNGQSQVTLSDNSGLNSSLIVNGGTITGAAPGNNPSLLIGGST